MIFKSRQVNLDPESWVTPDGKRHPAPVAPGGHWDFRPEFEPTRDPWPWQAYWYDGARAGRYAKSFQSEMGVRVWRFEPRREQFDTPVNPILVEFRRLWAGQVDMLEQAHEMANNLGDVDYLWEMADEGYTPEQVDHARRVLGRLADWSNA